ncbi:DNA cytosine methyltransferase [Nocardioides KLBMP 9356]|uniref:Cytosine-specific methyltransferase n=1 Tax=Nocardioides potassii TaxID=2911371 RepID=A0ABS9HCU3_9ACTN|nr:DNA cytosine methyltransferase [Nocardioides potassii]MCF6378163.1 DNA cytosine methyltransferase [Nocardioides potassii]
MPAPTAIDLFAGAGGATQGLRDAGFRVVAAVENDAHAAASWRLNHPGKMFESDVREVATADLAALLNGARLDLLKACPPCQGFSSLRGANDPDAARNDLVLDTIRLVDGLTPRAVLLENVPGLRRDARFPNLVAALRERGYGLRDYLVEASALGVPQRRRRLVLIAVDLAGSTPPPDTLDELIPPSRRPDGVTAGEALARLSDALPEGDPWHRWRQSRPAVRRRIEAVPVDGNRFDLPAEHQLECHTRLGKQVATASYGRVKAGAVAPTMTTRCTTPSCGSFIHPSEDRGLSIREAAAFQTFPHDYLWSGGYDSVERQIGNAVPVGMARELGSAVLRLLDGELPDAD